MAFIETLAPRIRDALARKMGVVEKKIFGGGFSVAKTCEKTERRDGRIATEGGVA